MPNANNTIHGKPRRFTIDGSDDLENRIARDMDRVRDAALKAVGPENLTALVLGGGYGRGEGGVYLVDGEERVYNDYDFFVVVPFRARNQRQAVAARLDALKPELEPACGVHVDFGPPIPAENLPSLPYELMYMEAKEGHVVIHGPKDVFDAMPDYDTSRPPLEECARLFMNRGVGLVLAGRTLRGPGRLDRESFEFVVRNIQKAYMAMGDSVLFRAGRYRTRYSERLAVLENLNLDSIPDALGLIDAYRDAIEFKLRPRHDVPDGLTLAAWHARAVERFLDMFLWFERARLGYPGMSWDEYAALPARLPRPRGGALARCLAQNIRHGRALGLGTDCLLQPRDRILKRLPALLAPRAKQDAAPLINLWSHIG